MAKKIISPDAEKARTLLDELWHEVQAEEELPTSPELDELVNSGVVAVRYSLPTQLLGKLTDPNLDCLCFQKLAVSPRSSWNPRTFSSKVVVPWVLANQNVLGTSTDPYVGNPLRIPRLEENTLPVKNRTDWKRLFEVLQKVEEENDPARTRLVLTSVLRSIKKKLAESVFEYAIPERVSLRQVREIVERFLSEASGGDRGLATAAALFETFGKHFGIYAEVRRFAINASDTSTGSTADIECVDNEGNLRLVIEVKERSLTLIDVKSAVVKARKSSIQEFLFNSPRINPAESGDVAELFAKTWASGTNFYQLSIDELIKVGLSLTGETGRKDFLVSVGKQLNQFNTQPRNRQRWKILLDEI